MLRQLRLNGCHVRLPPHRLLPALRQLGRLELDNVDLEEAPQGQLDVLPQLPHFTSLTLSGSDVVPWPAVLRCAGLRELSVEYPSDPPPAHLPPGSLSQLTRLVIPREHVSPAWLALPRLRSLVLTWEGWGR